MGWLDKFKKKPGEPAAVPPAPAVTPPSAPPTPAAPTPAASTPAAATPAASTPAASTPAASTPPAAAAPAAAAGPAPAATIELHDAFGRRVQVSRDEYRSRILPDLVKAHGSDPERLTAVILQATRDGFAADVLAAANRLTVIDKEPERCLSVLAVVQRDAGDLDAADATLRELLQKRPRSVSARVGQALLQDQRGQQAAAEALLWEALGIDPNHPDAVHGWLQLRHRAVGDQGYRRELDQLVALPGTWRPQLWLARLLLGQQDAAGASALYREVLGRADLPPDALLMASADLVQARQHALLDELVAKRFLPGSHHPHVGLALLHHYLQTQRHAEGSELLHRMHLHYGHVVGNELQPFTAEFDRLRLAKLPPPAPLPPNARIGLYRFDRPLWLAGLEEPQWLLPQKAAAAKLVFLPALAIEGDAQALAGREEELGRITRGVPLFLAEQLWLGSPHRATAALPVADGGGWVLMGRPWPEDVLAAQLTDAERQQAVIVTGVLRIDGDRRRIDLWAYDTAQKQRIGHAAAEGPAAELGKLLLQLLAELWPLLGGPAGHQPPVGDAAFWARYADGLAQHATLVAAQLGAMPKDRLFGERYIAQWLQSLVLQESRWQPGVLLYASGLAVLHQLGSVVAKEHGRAVAEFFRQSPPNSAFARLAVRPLRATGLDTLWQARRPEVVAAAGNDPAYTAWLQRAEAAK